MTLTKDLLRQGARGSCGSQHRSDEDGDRVALGLVDGLEDVACILAVDLKRQRPVAPDDDAVEVVRREGLAVGRAFPAFPWRTIRGRSRARRLTGAT